MSALRILEQQAKANATAVQSAQRSVQIALNTYGAGTQAYTNVITQQTALLTNQETALTVQEQRLVASVALVQALGRVQRGHPSGPLVADAEIAIS